MAANGDSSDGTGDLFLIDGNSLAYRAFFALPESIATSDGRPTNAIYGFAAMMVKVLTDFKPRAVVVAWDAGWSGREKVYEPYKAQRKSRPDLLKEQWPHLAPLSEAFGFANVRIEGWEADDVIASMVAKAREGAIPVMVVTGDRDAYQLVGDGVRVMSTSRGVTDTKIYDREGVIERYGVAPELVPDLIGLKGDTSDNIPGVPGIGEKTASQLLQEFGSLEGVLGNIDSISGPKRKQNLTEHSRGGPDLEAAGDDAHRHRGRARPPGADGARPRPLPAPRDRGRVRAPPGHPAARGRVGGRGAGPAGRLDDRGRGGRGDDLRPRRRRDLVRDRGRALGRLRRRRPRHRRASRARRPRRGAVRPPARRPRRQVDGRPLATRPAGRPRRGLARSRPRLDGRRLPDRSGPAHLRARRARRRRGLLGRRSRSRGARRRAALARGRGGGGRSGRDRAARLGVDRPPAREARRARARAGDERGRDAARRGSRRDGARGGEARHREARGDLRAARRPGRLAAGRDLGARRA